jgi:hypothetical protein
MRLSQTTKLKNKENHLTIIPKEIILLKIKIKTGTLGNFLNSEF